MRQTAASKTQRKEMGKHCDRRLERACAVRRGRPDQQQAGLAGWLPKRAAPAAVPGAQKSCGRLLGMGMAGRRMWRYCRAARGRGRGKGRARLSCWLMVCTGHPCTAHRLPLALPDHATPASTHLVDVRQDHEPRSGRDLDLLQRGAVPQPYRGVVQQPFPHVLLVLLQQWVGWSSSAQGRVSGRAATAPGSSTASPRAAATATP